MSFHQFDAKLARFEGRFVPSLPNPSLPKPPQKGKEPRGASLTFQLPTYPAARYQQGPNKKYRVVHVDGLDFTEAYGDWQSFEKCKEEIEGLLDRRWWIEYMIESWEHELVYKAWTNSKGHECRYPVNVEDQKEKWQDRDDLREQILEKRSQDQGFWRDLANRLEEGA